MTPFYLFHAQIHIFIILQPMLLLGMKIFLFWQLRCQSHQKLQNWSQYAKKSQRFQHRKRPRNLKQKDHVSHELTSKMMSLYPVNFLILVAAQMDAQLPKDLLNKVSFSLPWAITGKKKLNILKQMIAKLIVQRRKL